MSEVAEIEIVEQNIDNVDPVDHIVIKNARVNNLKDLCVAIPRNKLVVITGVSGSGKSSLAYDTLYAEGQRRYVESLSAYARQFLEKMQKPEVDYIKGIAPAMAIQQKTISHNPRSTVGTSTEIYDYLKLLFARIGKTISPVSGKEVKKHTVEDVMNYIHKLENGTKVQLVTDIPENEERTSKEELNLLLQKGFNRLFKNGEIKKIEELIDKKSQISDTKDLKLLIDRFVVQKEDENNRSRIAESIGITFYEGKGICHLLIEGKEKPVSFSNKFELDGISFEEPSPNFFTFNNPYGACSKCEGFGTTVGVDEDLVIPNKTLSIYDSAIACWRGEKMKKWNEKLVMNAPKFDFPVHRPYNELNKEEKQVLWDGNKHFKGLNRFFTWLEGEKFKIQYRVMLSRYRGKTVCPDCNGTRLRKDASYVKVGGKSILDLVLMPVSESVKWFEELKLTGHEQQVAKRILIEINNRLNYLNEVGLSYIALNRLSSSLSGGESQRIRLATILGSNLVSSMYILDEPSIGLHSRDTKKLIGVLKSLRDLGNTVIVVEHDADIIKTADHIIDIGVEAGADGGNLVFDGSLKDLLLDRKSITAKYFTGELSIPIPNKERNWKNHIEVIGARENNLKNISAKFPLNVMTVVTGVSGSGKSSLVLRVFAQALQKEIHGHGVKPGLFDELRGNIKDVSQVEIVDHNPIGKSSRSNPVTYIKAYDEIRKLYAGQKLSKVRGYSPKHFSFNVEGGRCDTCEGEGTVKIEMQFMADINLPCENCNGHRFKQEVLEVTHDDKHITDVLNMTIDEALDFFYDQRRILTKLQILSDVGLGYIKLGQSSTTLSGGEAQRVKLAYYLCQGANDDHTVYIFDEPTTGLHFHDINKLLRSLNALIEKGNTVIIIEHNPDVIKCADWVIDLGPEGGDAGGNLVFEGTPKELKNCKESYTGEFI